MRRLTRPLSCPLVAAAVGLAAAGAGIGAAWAQGGTNLGALSQRLEDVSAQATELRLVQGSLPASATAQFDLRLSALEDEIRRLTGLVEEAQNAADRNQAAMRSFQDDVDFRLNRLEQATGVLAGGAGAAPGTETAGMVSPGAPAPGTASPAPAPTPSPGPSAAPAPTGTPSTSNSSPQALAAYDAALGLLRKGEYLQAEASLKSFLASFGSDRLAANAQYWLGETYYARGDFRTAAQTFLTGVKTYPESAKAPDTFLKLGISLVQMGEKDRGCQVLGELPSRYPDASATIKSRAERGLRDGNCG
ncbi:tol-pal system protein YbgF [Zavarzinia compransoris]|uniref:tol-pal system protein YbgF n=1 Tax=Zavarzinia marina TaxID=2911065 RepID=UPI001F178EFD|nr:tol-pal system protein YbgF [Zavarzinia marina]MCF4165247.1 tol-pal system protein YbgF [Zavarzinia marina]